MQIDLRLEDLDPDRCLPAYADEMREALDWLGLDWDAVYVQSRQHADHAAALDQLEAMGRLYPCHCSRAMLRARGERSPDGGFRYPGTCRDQPLPPRAEGGWRASELPLRVALPSERIRPVDDGGLDLAQDPFVAAGDPVVRRRDGAIAYLLASVVDDAMSGVTRIVRGRDLASSSATQCALAQLLGWDLPRYRHHLLLLEPAGEKFAKLHGSVGYGELRGLYTGPEFVGWLAASVGLAPTAKACSPADLVKGFTWDRVDTQDRVLDWDGSRLQVRPSEVGSR
jgi:glutamyl-Q tRNA(Asp) synthetase